MSIEEFVSLPEQRKKEIIVDADKVGEYADDQAKYELFRIDRFFVEVKVSFIKRYRKISNTYFKKDIPLNYALK